MCLPMWAHWRHLANTTELMLLLPLAHLSPQSKRKSIGSAILTQLTAESRYTYNGLFFPQKLSLPMGVSGHLTHGFLHPPESQTQTASRSVQPFSHRRQQSVPILYNSGCPFPLKIAPSHGWIWTPSNTWFSREPVNSSHGQLITP